METRPQVSPLRSATEWAMVILNGHQVIVSMKATILDPPSWISRFLQTSENRLN